MLNPSFAKPGISLPRSTTTRYVATELAIILSAIFGYFFVRQITEGSREQAFANAARVIDFQESVGLAWEHTMQGWILQSDVLVTLANWMYIWGHWPVITIAGLWLLTSRPGEYRLTRNAFLISGGIALIIFATFPVAPPRLVDAALVDTVTENSNAYRVLQPPSLVNQYAAVPSLHFGWNLLVGIALVRAANNRAVQAFGFAMPVAMFLAIVLTANHYVIDAFAGGALALTGLAIAFYLQRSRAARQRTPAVRYQQRDASSVVRRC